jgi:hypothetical protein
VLVEQPVGGLQDALAGLGDVLVASHAQNIQTGLFIVNADHDPVGVAGGAAATRVRLPAGDVADWSEREFDESRRRGDQGRPGVMALRRKIAPQGRM